MKILSIGNSFSQDAQRYLHRIAAINNKDLTCANLYIGGCTLKRHYINLTDNEAAYNFQFNGEDTNLKISIKTAVKSNDWDYITIQQASHESFNFESYIPYLEKINEWLRLRSDAKILLHQTWAYPQNMKRLSEMGFKTTEEMFYSVKDAYERAKDIIHPDGMIKSGEAMLKAYQLIPEIVYRDDIHASYGFGRYLLGCVWYSFLFGEVPKNNIINFDENVADEYFEIISKILYSNSDVV